MWALAPRLVIHHLRRACNGTELLELAIVADAIAPRMLAVWWQGWDEVMPRKVYLVDPLMSRGGVGLVPSELPMAAQRQSRMLQLAVRDLRQLLAFARVRVLPLTVSTSTGAI